jgi:hypothetical protein
MRDWAQEEVTRREVGRRGEEAAYAFECRRVKEAGLDPSVVVWQSQQDETSPYDIQSVEDGQVLYIEVKSTTGMDPGAEFDVSSPELAWAISNGQRYAIYRVVDVDSCAPRIYRYTDIGEKLNAGYATLSLSGARMRLPRPAPSSSDDGAPSD